MNSKLIKYLRCPQCSAELYLSSVAVESIGTKIVGGKLLCGDCKLSYPIKDKIPRFVVESNYADTFGFQWNRHSRTQLDKFNGFSFSKDRFFLVTGWSENLKGELILEAGSGAGRFTQIACETGAEVISFDYSNAVDANLENNGEYENLHIFQGDIYCIPLEENSFDKVYCLGVLQHTPDVRKAFMTLVKYLKPGGEIVVDIYHNRLSALISWKYLLRPITKRMEKRYLYKIIKKVTPPLLLISNALQKILGNIGLRLLPIANYSHLGIPPELNLEWAVLDTFDMYSPAYDHPQSKSTLESWFREIDFQNVFVEYGLNGIIGRGKKPYIINETTH